MYSMKVPLQKFNEVLVGKSLVLLSMRIERISLSLVPQKSMSS